MDIEQVDQYGVVRTGYERRHRITAMSRRSAVGGKIGGTGQDGSDRRSGVATDFRVGGPETQGDKPRVPSNPVFSPDFGHLFFITALTP